MNIPFLCQLILFGLLGGIFISAQANDQIKNGEYLFRAAACGSCHGSENNNSRLAGGYSIKIPGGTLVTPNISPDKKFGIGGWSDQDFLNAVKRGVSPKGDHYYPAFPYASFQGMTDADVLSIKAYIETLPPVSKPSNDHDLSFPFNLRASLAIWKIANLNGESFKRETDKSAAFNRGKYLVNHVAHCGECHTPRGLTMGMDQSQALEGGTLPDGTDVPPISPKKIRSSVTQDEFINNFVMKASMFNGDPIEDKSMLKVTKNLTQMKRSDLEAIHAYLSNAEGDTNSNGIVFNAGTASSELVQLEESTREFLDAECKRCHVGRGDGVKKWEYTNLADLSASKLIVPGKPQSSFIFRLVLHNDMPKDKLLASSEIQDFGDWILALGVETDSRSLATTTKQPVKPLIGLKKALAAIAQDLNTVPAQDRSFTRYIKTTHIRDAQVYGKTAVEVDTWTSMNNLAIRKLLNSLSMLRSIYLPVGVAGTDQTILRIDLRELGWDRGKWKLIEAVYPFKVLGGNNEHMSRIIEDTGSSAPIIHADWLAHTATRPPLYEKLLGLPATVDALEQMLGVDSRKNIQEQQVIRAGFTEGNSGVSKHNRLIERHNSHFGYYWKSYDFAGSDGSRSLIHHPFGPSDQPSTPDGAQPFDHDGGEMIFSLPNGLQGYYLADARGQAITTGPTTIVDYRGRLNGRSVEITNGGACMGCHDRGIKKSADEIREVLLAGGFTSTQRQVGEKLYVPQSDLLDIYEQDEKLFMSALQKMGASTPNSDKQYTHALAEPRAGIKQEIVEFLSDQYDEPLNLARFAAELSLVPEKTVNAMNRINNASSLKAASFAVLQLQSGGRISRKDFENLFPSITGDITGLPTNSIIIREASSISELTLTSADRFEQANEKLRLNITVPSTDVFVGDLLQFSISTSKSCELQVWYEPFGEDPVNFPVEAIGNPILKEGEIRVIPDPKEFRARFDDSSFGTLDHVEETLFVQCRVGGLGDARLYVVKSLKFEKVKKDIVRKLSNKSDSLDRNQHELRSFKFSISR
jgi:mono/diheme cytochrome c family protein